MAARNPRSSNLDRNGGRICIEAQLEHSNGEAWSMGSSVLTKFAMNEDFLVRRPYRKRTAVAVSLPFLCDPINDSKDLKHVRSKQSAIQSAPSPNPKLLELKVMGDVGNIARLTLPAVRRSQISARPHPLVSTCSSRPMGSFFVSLFWNYGPMPLCTFGRRLEVELGLAPTRVAFDRASEAPPEIAR